MPSEFNSPDFRNPFTALIRHFESNRIRFQADQAGKWVRFYTTCECAAFSGEFQLSANDDTLQVSINFPVMARDCKMRPFVTELLVRINRNLVFGAFDNDVDTGQIGFYAGQLMPADGLDERIIVGLFGKCMSTCDRYFPALMRVMFSGYTPTDAVFLSELDVQADSVEDERPVQSPAAMAPKPPAKKPRAPRKDPRLKSTRELPGLFDQKPDDRDGHSGRP